MPLLRGSRHNTCSLSALSSLPALRWFGIVVVGGLAMLMFASFESLFSVWCFFAAVASIVMFFHFVTA